MSSDVLPLVLGAGWGALAGWPLARRASRAAVAVRLPEPARTDRVVQPLLRVLRRLAERTRRGPVANVILSVVTRRRLARREAVLEHELPVVIDLLRVAIGAGCTPYLAVEVAARWAPPGLAAVLADVRRDCALGVAFSDALDRASEAHPSFAGLVNALLASDRYGAPVGTALDRLAAEERAALRRRAEARARTVPVRLLFPLVFLVLPAFALLTVVPALLAGLSGT